MTNLTRNENFNINGYEITASFPPTPNYMLAERIKHQLLLSSADTIISNLRTGSITPSKASDMLSA